MAETIQPPHSLITDEDLNALRLATYAGLSTTLGALVAVIRKPNDATLAFLLGLALGVMATLSLVELWIKNAFEHGFVMITVSLAAGFLLYYIAQPFFPEFEIPAVTGADSKQTTGNKPQASNSVVTDGAKKRSPRVHSEPKVEELDRSSTQGDDVSKESTGDSSTLKPAQLLRLGLLMAFTMTLHNMPEGLAVAFSSYTGLGWVMAIAIALHNIPEGIIVAAPVFAATGSRVNALLIATLSGLSEPFGALISILFVKPFLTERRIQCTMSFMGGIMLAVCALELWPEAKKCKFDRRAWQGIGLGAVLMGATLCAEF